MAIETVRSQDSKTEEFASLRKAIDSLPRDLRDMVDDAYSLAAYSHYDQKRIGGEIEQRHLERVTLACANHARKSGMSDEDRARMMASSILHDAVEDTLVTEEQIAGRFDEGIMRTVHALSHPKLRDGTLDENEPPEVYLRRAAEAGQLAILIRRFDRLDNLNTLSQTPDDFRRKMIAETKAALAVKVDPTDKNSPSLWEQMDLEGARMIRRAAARAESVDHISAEEGVSRLWEALASVPGVSMEEFWNTPKGREAKHTKKFITCGLPQSGKSTMKEILRNANRAIPDAPYLYPYTAVPDGEISDFQKIMARDPALAARIKAQYKQDLKEGGSFFTPEAVARHRESIKNISAPSITTSIIDVGGHPSDQNREICEFANGAILLCGEKGLADEDLVEWKRLLTGLGIPIVAEIYSDYWGARGSDFIRGVGNDGVFRASMNYLERGEMDFESRPSARALLEFIYSLPTEKVPSKEEYVRQAMENLRATSRTTRGEVNVEVAEGKADIVNGVSEQEAAGKSVDNFSKVLERLYKDRDKVFTDASELRNFVEGIAKEVNQGIIKEGILIRTHDVDKYPYTRVENLGEAMSQFYAEFFDRLQRGDDPQELAAWAEYRIDLTDHFFADGCGKTATAVEAWVLMRSKQQLPKYRTRDEYYAHAPTVVRGTGADTDREQYERWTTYYKSLFSSQ